MTNLRKFASNKVWVVTGAAHGIGRELSKLIAAHHGIVWAIDLDMDALETLRKDAAREGQDIFPVQGDVTNAEMMTQIIQSIRAQSKRIDVWINNAGVQRVGAFEDMSESEFDLVLNINMLSVIRLTRQITKLMTGQGSGVVLNMASVAGHVPSPFMTAYVAAKHGVVGFTRSLQAEFELLRSPIRAAFASPGFVDTAIIERGADRGFPEWLSWMLSDPASCAREILIALARGDNEIKPTMSGQVMRMAYSIMPRTTVRSSKVLLTKGMKDALLGRYQVPR